MIFYIIVILFDPKEPSVYRSLSVQRLPTSEILRVTHRRRGPKHLVGHFSSLRNVFFRFLPLSLDVPPFTSLLYSSRIFRVPLQRIRQTTYPTFPWRREQCFGSHFTYSVVTNFVTYISNPLFVVRLKLKFQPAVVFDTHGSPSSSVSYKYRKRRREGRRVVGRCDSPGTPPSEME